MIKVHTTLGGSQRAQIIRCLLSNRCIYVDLLDERRRCCTHCSGLPHGRVLAPLLFDICANDEPESEETERFIYADDLCLVIQSRISMKFKAPLQPFSWLCWITTISNQPQSQPYKCACLASQQQGHRLGSLHSVEKCKPQAQRPPEVLRHHS